MPLETHTCKRFFTLLNFESYITEIRYMLEVGLGKFYKRAAIHSASRSYGFVDRGLNRGFPQSSLSFFLRDQLRFTL